jgi:hypothetical protein
MLFFIINFLLCYYKNKYQPNIMTDFNDFRFPSLVLQSDKLINFLIIHN